MKIDLSTDGGATYPTPVLATTPSDGSQNLVVNGAWTSGAASVQINGLKNGAVTDQSNAAFRVQ